MCKKYNSISEMMDNIFKDDKESRVYFQKHWLILDFAHKVLNLIIPNSEIINKLKEKYSLEPNDEELKALLDKEENLIKSGLRKMAHKTGIPYKKLKKIVWQKSENISLDEILEIGYYLGKKVVISLEDK